MKYPSLLYTPHSSTLPIQNQCISGDFVTANRSHFSYFKQKDLMKKITCLKLGWKGWKSSL